jgi:hypothetical protein
LECGSPGLADGVLHKHPCDWRRGGEAKLPGTLLQPADDDIDVFLAPIAATEVHHHGVIFAAAPSGRADAKPREYGLQGCSGVAGHE